MPTATRSATRSVTRSIACAGVAAGTAAGAATNGVAGWADRLEDLLVRTLRAAARTTCLLLLVAASWWAWFGWDAPGRLAPLPGDGVYHAWQGVGCLLCVLALAVRGYRRLAPALVGVAVTVGFSGAYALDVLGRHSDGPAVLAVAVVTVGAAKASLALGSLGPAILGRRGPAGPAPR